MTTTCTSRTILHSVVDCVTVVQLVEVIGWVDGGVCKPEKLSSSSDDKRVSERRLSETSSLGLEDALSMDSRGAGFDDATERVLR